MGVFFLLVILAIPLKNSQGLKIIRFLVRIITSKSRSEEP